MLTSPRSRRRALRISIALALVGAALFVGLRYSNTGNKALRPADSRGNQAEPMVAVAEPERVPLTPEARDAALGTAQQFLRTAVSRRDLGESWELTHPDLRQGITRSEWVTGDIPVVPYPVDTARWKLDFSYRDTLGIQVLVSPTPGSTEPSMAFAMELKTAKPGDRRRWLVSQWAPMGGTINQRPGGGGQPLAASKVPAYESPLAAGWIFVPIGAMIAVLLALPSFVVVREWRRRRHAERAWRADQARRGARGLDLD